jgi:hypothetical protein
MKLLFHEIQIVSIRLKTMEINSGHSVFTLFLFFYPLSYSSFQINKLKIGLFVVTYPPHSYSPVKYGLHSCGRHEKDKGEKIQQLPNNNNRYNQGKI